MVTASPTGMTPGDWTGTSATLNHLGLGVLLIGIVAAFFFRNEPSSDEIPQLKNSQHLNDQIAEKSVTPYLTGLESDETAASDSLPNYSELSAFAESSGDISGGSRKTLTPPTLPDHRP